MGDPYTEDARVIGALSAENGLLRAEVERLTRERETNVFHDLWVSAEAEVKRLRAENKELRKYNSDLVEAARRFFWV